MDKTHNNPEKINPMTVDNKHDGFSSDEINKKTTLRDYATTITILDSISDCIFILNNGSKIEYANKSALSLLGIELEQLVNRNFHDILIYPFSKNEVESSQQDNQSNNEKPLTKLNLEGFEDVEASLAFNGMIFPVLLNFSVIRDENDDVNYLIVSARNVSNLQSIEKKIREQQALSISQNRISSLSELSIGLVHELTQPLLALKLKIELMMEENQKSNQFDGFKDALDDINALVNRMSESINNIRTFATQAEDQLYAAIDINANIRQSVNLISYELKKNNINLGFDIEQKLPFIIANPLLLQQVFINLVTNSREAFNDLETDSNRTNGRDKNISISAKANADKWIEIMVEDNAGGIASGITKKIFDPFFTTKKPWKNSGIGLAFAKNIITSLGGDITLKVLDGIGSQFLVRIPIMHDEEQAQLFNLIELMNKEAVGGEEVGSEEINKYAAGSW